MKKHSVRYAVAVTIRGEEHYLRDASGDDDCYTDDIGCAIHYDNLNEVIPLTRGEYIVKVEDEDGLYVVGTYVNDKESIFNALACMGNASMQLSLANNWLEDLNSVSDEMKVEIKSVLPVIHQFQEKLREIRNNIG